MKELLEQLRAENEVLRARLAAAEEALHARRGEQAQTTRDPHVETEQAFLLALGDALRPLEKAEEIKAMASQVLGEQLQTERVFYGEVEANGEYLLIPRDYYTNGKAPSITGRYRIRDYSAFVFRELYAQRLVVVADAETIAEDSAAERAGYAALAIRAFVAYPLVKGGRLVAVLGVTQTTPRRWTTAEVSLIQETAERTWAAVERARAEEARRKSEIQLRLITDAMPALISYIDRDVRYRFVNRTYSEWFNTPSEEILGKTMAEVLGQAAYENLRPHVESALAGNVENFEADAPYKYGRRFIRASYTPDVAPDGTVHGFFVLVLDISAQKAAEEERMRLAAIVSSSYDAILSKTMNGIITSWNASAERMFGYRADEMLQQPILRLIPPELHDEEERILTRLRSGESIKHYETTRVTKDGRRLAVSLTISPLQDNTGKIIGASKIVRDITERKEAEAQLREAQRFTQSIIEAMPSLTYIYDLENSCNIFISQQTLDVLGYTAEEVQALQTALLPTLLHPDDVARMQERMGKILADTSDEIFEDEYRMQRKDGTWVWLFDRARVFRRAPDGRPTQLLGVATDITSRKAIEEKLREAEERQRLALESGEMGAWVWDIKNKCGFVDERTLALFGVLPADWHGDPETLFARIWPEDKPQWESTIADAIKNHTSYQDEFRVLLPDGQTRWLAGYGRTEYDTQGNPLLMRGIHFDITARKQNEAERERLLAEEHRAREVAEAATRSKDEFLAVVSHELRNPLNAILGYTRLLRAHPHDVEKVLHNGEIIYRNAKIQQQLIEDLLDTARIISGKLAIEAAPTDLRLVLEDVLTVVQPAAAARKIDLRSRLGHEPQMILGDAMRLQQVVWNLLQNAIKFTPEGGRVELRLERDAQRVYITVQDTGKGIEPEFLPAVFDRFSQNDMSRTRRHGGLGLGLALTKQLVEMHGGTIHVWSAGAGLGARFTVALPHQSSLTPTYQPPPAVAHIQGTEETIPLSDLPRLDKVQVLVVDDQEEARLLVAATLREWGATVTTAASGAQARALLAERKFDVLVCDIAMPEEDGYEVMQKIRAREEQANIPLSQRLAAVALTARTRTEDRLQALGAGYQMHVAKPVELAELIVVIHTLVHHHSREAQPFS